MTLCSGVKTTPQPLHTGGGDERYIGRKICSTTPAQIVLSLSKCNNKYRACPIGTSITDQTIQLTVYIAVELQAWLPVFFNASTNTGAIIVTKLLRVHTVQLINVERLPTIRPRRPSWAVSPPAIIATQHRFCILPTVLVLLPATFCVV